VVVRARLRCSRWWLIQSQFLVILEGFSHTDSHMETTGKRQGNQSVDNRTRPVISTPTLLVLVP